MEVKYHVTKQWIDYQRDQGRYQKIPWINENENTTTQNLGGPEKAVLRGKFIALQTCLKIQEKSQINNLTLHLKELEKE